MFTGIVEETGDILAVHETADGRRLRIGTSFDDVEEGASVSVSGVCLTAEATGRRSDRAADGQDNWLEVFLATETVERTYLDRLVTGDAVNLERAMPADGRFDGHFVQGHVDGTATVSDIESAGDDWYFSFDLPDENRQYVVEKGSLTVDGISLTVAALDEDSCSVAIIPETYERTTLSEKAVGDPVHLEVDVIAKYVEQLVA